MFIASDTRPPSLRQERNVPRHLRPVRFSGALVRYRAASYKDLAPPQPKQVRQVS
jgi:hypothetical protein